MRAVISSPLSVPVSKNKNFILNLNNFRNTHYQTLNKAKITYKAIQRERILTLPNFNRIKLTCVTYPKTKRKFDLDNVGSIHIKFFLDALVELGKLPEDNYEHVISVQTVFGEVCKYDPRVDIIIEEIENEDCNPSCS